MVEENSSAEEDLSAEDCFISGGATGLESLGSGGGALGGGLLPGNGMCCQWSEWWIPLRVVDLSAEDLSQRGISQ